MAQINKDIKREILTVFLEEDELLKRLQWQIKQGKTNVDNHTQKTLWRINQLSERRQDLISYLTPPPPRKITRGKYKVRTLHTFLNPKLTAEKQEAGIAMLTGLLNEHNHPKSRANNCNTAREMFYIVKLAVESGLLTEMPDTLYASLKNSGIEINCPKNTFNDNVPPLNSLDENKKLYKKLKEEIGSRFDDIVGGNE